MPNNTKARSSALRSIAEEIIRREKIDLENLPLNKRRLIAEIAVRGNCHVSTASTVFYSVFGAMRWGKPVIDANEFECPRCFGRAYYYSNSRAACINCGWLLYTEIPREVRSKGEIRSRDWKNKIIDGEKVMSNKELFDKVLRLASGDDLDEQYTERVLWQYEYLDAKLRERLSEWLSG